MGSLGKNFDTIFIVFVVVRLSRTPYQLLTCGDVSVHPFPNSFSFFITCSNIEAVRQFQSINNDSEKNVRNASMKYRPVSSVVKQTAIGAGGLGFNSRTGQNRIQCRQWLANAETFLRSSIAQALSCGDMPRYLLQASA